MASEQLKWKVFYGDGSTYCDEDGSHLDAPRQNVQGIARKHERVGRVIERAEDYYVWWPDLGGWRGVDRFGLFDYLLHQREPCVLFGRMMDDDAWNDMIIRITKDTYLPAQSGKLPRH